MLYEAETFWLNQKKIAKLFGVDVRTISEHLVRIFATGELVEAATVRKIRRVQREGARDVSREIEFYNLDAIIAVGYRVNSARATQSRIWATQTATRRGGERMKLQLDPNQGFQLGAVAAITDLFDGQPQGAPEYSAIKLGSVGEPWATG